MPRQPQKDQKKIVILCFDRSEEAEINAFISNKRYQASQIEPESGDDLQIDVIFPADVSNDDFMTYGDHLSPTREEKKILQDLTPNDNIYIWGHGAPNYAYIPGAFYTEVADFIAQGIDHDKFHMRAPLKINCEMCNGGRGGPTGEASLAGRLHSYLGKSSVSPVFEKPAGTSKSPAGTKTGDKYASGGPGRPGPP